MTPEIVDIFDLSNLAKADPNLIERDREQFAAISGCLRQRIAGLTTQLEELRKAPGGKGREASERDSLIRHTAAQLSVLQRFGLDICLGRMVYADAGSEPVYIGRIGLSDDLNNQLLVDWRAPASEPFFAATGAHPMGLASRRRYRWRDGRIHDYWDEVFRSDELEGNAALDDQSAFIASLGAARSPRMRDVLSTIQADQDAIIRAGSRGALVVEGGPGTGKTVVALHRAAYLLYVDPRLDGHRGGVLIVGPHQPYLNFIADVLPSLGEYGVATCTLREMVPEGATALVEHDPAVAALKSSAAMVAALRPAVAFYEEPPTRALMVETDWNEIELDTDDWAEAFDARDPALPHNEARDEIWFALIDILIDKNEDDIPTDLLHRSLLNNPELRSAFSKAWPILEANELVGDLWSVPAYLHRCAPWLSRDEIVRLQRDDSQAWTSSDLPLLDEARRLIGDPQASMRAQRRTAALQEQREFMDEVVDYILAADDNPDSTLQMLRGEDFRTGLLDENAVAQAERDALDGPFAHVIVDEAQDLTDAQWQMLLARCPSQSFTIVGDRAQARAGFHGSWEDKLHALGVHEVAIAKLTINYRTPIEIMDEAEKVIRSVLPDADVPTSVRSSGVPVRYGDVSELDAIVDDLASQNAAGTTCIIAKSTYPPRDGVQALTPETAKGMEFDRVVLVDDADPEPGIAPTIDRYVAMTRATQTLVVLTGLASAG